MGGIYEVRRSYWFRNSEADREGDALTHRQHGDRINLFQESKLKQAWFTSILVFFRYDDGYYYDHFRCAFFAQLNSQ
jgi:hypothetical protein